MRKIGFLLLLISASAAYGQRLERRITYGIFAGGMYSKITNIEKVLIPDNMYAGYTIKEPYKFGYGAGAFLNWYYPEVRISFQPELYYSYQTGQLEYTDTNGLNYTLKFPYHSLNVGFMVKFYFTEGFYAGMGPYFNFNLDKDALEYRSNGSEMSRRSGVYFEPDAVVQNVLKQSLEGKDYFHLGMGVGYEFDNKLNIGIRYHLGLSDALETQQNGHRYREQNNMANAFFLNIGYRFTFDGYNNF